MDTHFQKRLKELLHEQGFSPDDRYIIEDAEVFLKWMYEKGRKDADLNFPLG